VIIHNWADAALAPIARHESALTIGYSGNLGRAHEVDTMIAAMRILPEVRFVFIGGGAQLDRVRREALPNVELRPYAPRERLAESLSSVDAHLVTLQPALEGLIVPSKFYGVLAVGRPVIFIGARDGELARIIESERAGFVVEPGDPEGLVQAIQSIDPEMGARGRALYTTRFAPELAFAAWERVLEEAST
jgi:glycosyltransferase involved in cell wall biosynthesis